MKTKLLLLFTIISANTFSQNVFPESDAIWNIQIDGKEHYYGLSGDTIINDTIYNKLYLLNDTTLIIDSGDEYIGGFRQEEKKVYFRPNLPADLFPQYPQETLLYDFSKNVGDTIWHNIVTNLHIHYWSIGENISASIIYNIRDTENGKIYESIQYLHLDDGSLVETGRNDFWIENIGSLNSGLFWFLSQKTLSGTPKFRLACFKQGDELKYLDPDCKSCFSYTTGILEKNMIRLEVIQENTFIKIKGENAYFPCQLKIFNLMGQPIFEKTIHSPNEKVLINHWGLGLYRIEKEREIIKTGKISSK
jgi:hypothetical protein